MGHDIIIVKCENRIPKDGDSTRCDSRCLRKHEFVSSTSFTVDDAYAFDDHSTEYVAHLCKELMKKPTDKVQYYIKHCGRDDEVVVGYYESILILCENNPGCIIKDRERSMYDQPEWVDEKPITGRWIADNIAINLSGKDMNQCQECFDGNVKYPGFHLCAQCCGDVMIEILKSNCRCINIEYVDYEKEECTFCGKEFIDCDDCGKMYPPLDSKLNDCLDICDSCFIKSGKKPNKIIPSHNTNINYCDCCIPERNITDGYQSVNKCMKCNKWINMKCRGCEGNRSSSQLCGCDECRLYCYACIYKIHQK